MSPRAIFQRLERAIRPPSVIAMAQPAAVAVRAAITLVFMPPLDRPEPASPAIASISGVIASISGRCAAAASPAGWRYKARPHPTGARRYPPRHHRDLRGQPVIVAIADLVGGDGVVLVDDRHRAAPQKGGQRRARVQVAPPVPAVVQRQQDLRRGDPVGRQRLFPGARQPDLPHRRRRLRLVERQRPGPSANAARPSAMEPEETTITSVPRALIRAMSAPARPAIRCARHRSRPASTSRDEPIFTTSRRARPAGGLATAHGLHACGSSSASRAATRRRRSGAQRAQTSVMPVRATPDMVITWPPDAASSAARRSAISSGLKRVDLVEHGHPRLVRPAPPP
jgi:hypothetical protein